MLHLQRAQLHKMCHCFDCKNNMYAVKSFWSYELILNINYIILIILIQISTHFDSS